MYLFSFIWRKTVNGDKLKNKNTTYSQKRVVVLT